MALRVVAISAPHYQAGATGELVLTSSDPVSLFNGCRHSAAAAALRRGAWGDSNWCGDRADRRRSVLLLHSLDAGLVMLEAKLDEVRPQLLLIGAMSLCLPGAIACARRAREMLGDRVAIVLGGWHASETMFRAPDGSRVLHHAGSPARLMAEGHLPEDTFDVVVSGEAGGLITRIGELIATGDSRFGAAPLVRRRLSEASTIPGDWIAAYTHKAVVHEVVGSSSPPPDVVLPPPSTLFGISTCFDVFDGKPTAHVFSDSGRGCIYDCTFCSEGMSAVGSRPRLQGAADRLDAQMRAANAVVAADHPGLAAAAFVEDSVFLGGSPKMIERFVSLARAHPTGVTFGCQFTIDQILSRKDLIIALASLGLSYVFVGLETSEPPSIGGLSKNVRPQTAWLNRMEEVLEFLSSIGVSCGVAVLFGLGEHQQSRLQLLAVLRRWRQQYQSPRTISFNWAVQHPLRGNDGGANYRYLDWALPDSDWRHAFEPFGEASAIYPLAGRHRPDRLEIAELRSAIEVVERPDRRTIGVAVPTKH